ncbi:hypothetical protein F5Y17DRAFT_152839 [Xylariaceae sp. FL0594]|nr:hypothetical protein F5Y17DRAFT_152839 [Xylariaceae sp. FL0594]
MLLSRKAHLCCMQTLPSYYQNPGTDYRVPTDNPHQYFLQSHQGHRSLHYLPRVPGLMILSLVTGRISVCAAQLRIRKVLLDGVLYKYSWDYVDRSIPNTVKLSKLMKTISLSRKPWNTSLHLYTHPYTQTLHTTSTHPFRLLGQHRYYLTHLTPLEFNVHRPLPKHLTYLTHLPVYTLDIEEHSHTSIASPKTRKQISLLTTKTTLAPSDSLNTFILPSPRRPSVLSPFNK